VTLRFNRYNSRGDVVGQSDAAGVTTWAATYQADGRRTGEIGTNLNPKHATGRVRELGVNRDRHRANSKEEDPTGLLNEGFRNRDMETGTFISRDPLGHVDGPNVYCYVGQNPWTAFDPEGLELMVAGEGAIHHNGTQYSGTPSFFDAIFRGDAVLDRRDRSEWKRAQRIADPRHRRPDLPSDEQIRQTRERVASDVEPSAKITASYATAAEREAGIAYVKETLQAPQQDENLMRLHNRSAGPGATSDLAAQIGSDTNRDIALQWMGARLFRGLTNYARTAQAAKSAPRLGTLKQAGPGVWESSGGLRYGADPNHGNRVQHVLRHSVDDPMRAGANGHGVFDAGRTGTLGVIDEAWQIAQRGGSNVTVTTQGTRTVYNVDMGRRVGYTGGQAGGAAGHPAANNVRIVVEGTNDLITAFPFR
jgi:RHS repeat-associated protein